MTWLGVNLVRDGMPNDGASPRAKTTENDTGIMCQLVQASVSENQAWRSVKFQNEIKVLVLDTELLRIPRGFEGSFDGPCKA